MTQPAREPLLVAGSWLAEAGVASPGLDAQLLLAHVLGIPRGRLLPSTEVTADQQERFEQLVARRMIREPLQYIVGDAAFRHVIVAVGPGVFVPRPETELLVDAVLPALRAASPGVAVDLCAGSGALALALADEAPGARVLAVERDGPAVPWLERNTADTRVEIVVADIADPDLGASDVVRQLSGGVDAVVCNPPYVPAATAVGAEVRFDPPAAVFAGPDGLALMPAVLERAAQLLRAGGLLALEHDDTHAESVPALVAAHDAFTDVVEHQDLAGRQRYVVASRR